MLLGDRRGAAGDDSSDEDFNDDEGFGNTHLEGDSDDEEEEEGGIDEEEEASLSSVFHFSVSLDTYTFLASHSPRRLERSGLIPSVTEMRRTNSVPRMTRKLRTPT